MSESSGVNPDPAPEPTDDWADFLLGKFAEPGQSQGSHAQESEKRDGKSRTRPFGSGGSHAYRQDLLAMQRQRPQRAADDADADNQVDHESRPGTAAFARAAKIANALARRRQRDADAEAAQDTSVVAKEGKTLLSRFRSIGSDLQKKLMLSISDMRAGEEENANTNSYIQKILYRLRPGRSFTAQAAESNETRETLLDDDRRLAKLNLTRLGAAVLEGAYVMAGGLLASIHEAIGDHGVEVLMLIKRRRYDETPLKLRAASATDLAGQPFKVIQSEMTFGVLLKRHSSGSSSSSSSSTISFIRCALPTQLTIADAVTAETLKASQETLEEIPELRALSRQARLKIQMVMTDRAAANIKCEKGMQLNDASWCKHHAFCKVHKVAQQQTVTSKLIDGHISGLISLAVGMQMGGSTNKMRKCLATVLSQRVVVCVGDPPLDPARGSVSARSL